MGIEIFIFSVCRSISLVGEKERKMLKEIVKQAKTPVKSRILPPGQWVGLCVPLIMCSSEQCHLVSGWGFVIMCSSIMCKQGGFRKTH